MCVSTKADSTLKAAVVLEQARALPSRLTTEASWCRWEETLKASGNQFLGKDFLTSSVKDYAVL